MKGSNKFRDIVQLLAGIVAFLLLAYISTFYFFRLDLTSEKRHSLTDSSKELVSELNDIVYVKVYLKGDYPADYQRLQQAVKEKLDEMRAYSEDNLQYEFIDPAEAADEQTQNEFYQDLVKQGLEYMALQIREKDGVREQIIFPGAIVSYKDKSVPVQLLRTADNVSTEVQVNRAINNLEYEFANAIQQVTEQESKRIAFIHGHGELTEMETRDLENELIKRYDVAHVTLGQRLDALSKQIGQLNKRENKFDAIIIAKPDSAFPEQDKYLIDQFIMKGGHVLWLIDPMNAHMDSLRSRTTTMATPKQLNLEDMLFNYGVRLNHDLLLDRNCAPIGLMTGSPQNQKMELFPWFFYPVITPKQPHPIVHNVEPIITRFVSSIDTVGEGKIKKDILLTTSDYTRVYKSPVRISLNMVQIDPRFGESRAGNVPMAVLLEGEFNSVYANRLAPKFLKQEEFDFTEKGKPAKMLVVADGDVVRNEVDREAGRFRPLGYDKYAKNTVYGNKEFLLNTLNYLLGDASIIDVRSRNVTLRKLDAERIMKERTFWQVLNIGGPVVLVVLLGIGVVFLRRRRFATK